MSRRTEIARVAGATTLVIAALLAASALAANGIRVVKNTTPASGSTSSRTAKCDKGDQALAGGFASTADSGALAQQSFPVNGNSWTVETLGTGMDAGSTTAYALCQSAKARDVKIVSQKRTFPAGGSSGPAEAAVKAQCPKGWHVLSGGYADRPPFTDDGSEKGEIAIDTSKRTKARTWTVHAGNDGAPSAVEAFAICGKASTGPVKQVAATDSSSDDSSQTAKAKCPHGSHVVGGGFEVKPNEAVARGIPDVLVSRPAGGGAWLSHWLIDGGLKKRVATSMTSYAECES